MKKFLGFTLVEILIAMSVLGVIVVITASSVFRSGKVQEKAIEASSYTFYNGTQIAIGEIIRDEAPSGIKYLTSEQLMNYFVQHMEGVHLTNDSGVNGDCSSFKGGTVGTTEYMNDEVKCARFLPKIVAGFYVNPECTQSVTIKEYFKDDMDERSVPNACGYIIYESLNSRGVFGKDLFVIGLGNRRFK